MRTDWGVTEPLPQAEQLAQNFEKIGFSVEGDPWGAKNRQDDTVPKMLPRWQKPLVNQVFGLAADPNGFEVQAERVMQRLGRATGHVVRPADAASDSSADAKVDLLILHASDRVLELMIFLQGPLNKDEDPERLKHKQGLAAQVAEWRLTRSPCTALFWFAKEASEDRSPGELLFAIALIRAEMPDALLEACLEEELAQSMGLLADHEELRPSIFNDDQEFALLTRQDELLLKILYDPRLSPGMPPETAMPIVRQIARELTSGL